MNASDPKPSTEDGQPAPNAGDAAPKKETPPVGLKPLRVWPVVVLILGMLAARWTPVIVPDGPEMLWMIPAFIPALCGILILLWWLTVSRASWKERLVGLLGVVLIIVGVSLASHPSMAGPAMMVITIPVGFAGFGMALVLQYSRLTFSRTLIALAVAALCFGFSGLLRAEGLWGNFAVGIDWRWNPSAEELFLADRTQGENADPTTSGEAPPEPATLKLNLADPEWPGFRGRHRDGVQTGTLLATDWNTNPPKKIWRQRVGPGWSSFAVSGEVVFTQEQRGETEAVVCYRADDGKEVWAQSEAGRLEDPLGGPGPRATPTIGDQGLYATFATGWLMRLDPQTGQVKWKVDLREVADRKPPEWGFCASPLVVDSTVVVHAGGKGDKGVLAFDVESGDLQWSSPAGDHSYGSVQLIQLGDQRLLGWLSNDGAALVKPEDGADVLRHAWKVEGYRCLQPMLADKQQLLIPTGMGFGTRCLQLNVEDDKLTATTLWTSRGMKPEYSDCVLIDDHIYGFDGPIFACISASNGDQMWKRGRYGKGQVLAIADSKLLLVLTEYGEIILVKPDPQSHQEVARFQAIEGKTWNHPVLIGDRLYLRNSEEAACYQLPVKSS